MTEEDKKPRLPEVAERMWRLFKGNERSVGRFNPTTSKVMTDDRAPTVADFIDHIRGKEGAGVVPIMDDGNLWWAALDIDNHGEDADIPIIPLEQKSMQLNLPLIMCRSKSGGIHAYAFFSHPMPAAKIRALMAGWSEALGYAGCEVFPKQNKLYIQSDGKKSLGNWINLPYMGGKDTIRYAVVRGEKIGLLDFLELAENRRIDEKFLAQIVTGQYSEAPPCIKACMGYGVGEGNRNEALFNVSVFLRKAFPNDYAKRAEELNPIIFSKPLGKTELTRTITSAGRPDYSYRCNEEPIRSYCEKGVCLSSKFGITAKESENLELIQELPSFSDLVKYVTEPIRWEINIGGSKVANLSTQQLLDWRVMRELIAEKLMRVVPMIKPVEWERILVPLMESVRVVDTPDDASVAGVIRLRLKEFAAKTDLMSKGQNVEDRRALLRGLPCVQDVEGERSVLFRSQDFINYLKRTKSEEMKGTNLWFAVRDLGVAHMKVRAGEHSINVWRIPVDVVVNDWAEAEAPVFTSEL
jgi:hypothetical protein